MPNHTLGNVNIECGLAVNVNIEYGLAVIQHKDESPTGLTLYILKQIACGPQTDSIFFE